MDPKLQRRVQRYGWDRSAPSYEESWREQLAPALAKEIGIDELTDEHWKVIRFLRSDFEAEGETATLRRVSTLAGVSTKDLYKLFPKKPAKKMSYVSGLQKPTGCV